MKVRIHLHSPNKRKCEVPRCKRRAIKGILLETKSGISSVDYCLRHIQEIVFGG